LDVEEVLNWDDGVYREKLKGSAMKRVKLPVLKRNAEIVRETLHALTPTLSRVQERE